MGDRPPRRRRRPEEAEAEILASASRLLRRRPLHELTIEEIMRGTTLSRKSFYVYFADRYTLLARLFEPLRERLDRANRIFLEGGGDLLADGRKSFGVVAEVVASEGAPIRALWEASHHDRTARRVWREFHEPVVAGFAEKLRREAEAGTLPPVDPTAVARALIGMNLFAFFDEVVGQPPAERERVVDRLYTIWVRALTLARAPSEEAPRTA